MDNYAYGLVPGKTYDYKHILDAINWANHYEADLALWELIHLGKVERLYHEEPIKYRVKEGLTNNLKQVVICNG